MNPLKFIEEYLRKSIRKRIVENPLKYPLIKREILGLFIISFGIMKIVLIIIAAMSLEFFLKEWFTNQMSYKYFFIPFIFVAAAWGFESMERGFLEYQEELRQEARRRYGSDYSKKVN